MFFYNCFFLFILNEREREIMEVCRLMMFVSFFYVGLLL